MNLFQQCTTCDGKGTTVLEGGAVPVEQWCHDCDESGYVPVVSSPKFQLTIMRGAKVVKRWPMRNEARAVKGKADWEHDRDTRSVYFKGCHAVIERREVTAWRT